MSLAKPSRRELFRITAVAGGALCLQVTVPAAAVAAQGDTLVESKELNVYVQISPDGQITIYSSTPEMGQGIKTTLPMVIAEEMGARWEDVRVVDAPLDAERYGLQGAGGSTSVPRNFGTMRRMGASAREMLIGAAALQLEVAREGLEARESRVVHSSGRSRSFGELARMAAEQPLPDPETLSFKDPQSYTIIGSAVSGVDNLVVATGQSEFGIDVAVPGMQFASYTRCPQVGGRAQSFNARAIKALPGIQDAFILEHNEKAGEAQMGFLRGAAILNSGVAIVGDDTWSVLKAKRQLEIKWDLSSASTDDWESKKAWAKRVAAEELGNIRRDDPGVESALEDAGNRTVQGFYEFPYVAHVCMEPMNCTADFRKGQGDAPDSVEVWTGSQFPGQIKELANNFLGLAPEQVTVHGMRMGGGFGRRALHDYVTEAIAISRQVGTPIKLTWDRTDDIHNDFFRIGGFQDLRGAIDSNGKLAGLDQHYIGFSKNGEQAMGSGIFGNELTMSVLPNTRVRHSMKPIDTHVGAWRAPGSNTNAFVEQSFLHELAVLANRDHREFLLELLGERRWVVEGNVNAVNTGRAIDVIKRATDEAGWGRSMPKGRGLGLAFYFCHAAHVAEVAEVSVDADKNLRVHRVTAAIDVGPIINMSGALNQVQGAIVDGLSTMALQQITMVDGVIQQGNFDQYPVMRIGATPQIDVHFVQSDNPPTGLGEPALPPLAPAVANAIQAATGERVRSMPLSAAGYQLV